MLAIPSPVLYTIIHLSPMAHVPAHAFLIVNGAEIFPLEKEHVRIGRMDDNDLILSNPHISRYHAELRAFRGRFYLLDLGSTSGTAVNGERVNKAALNPGDVLSIAGIPLIYGENAAVRSIRDIPLFSPEKTRQGKLPTSNTESVDVGPIDRMIDLFKPSEPEDGE